MSFLFTIIYTINKMSTIYRRRRRRRTTFSVFNGLALQRERGKLVYVNKKRHSIKYKTLF
jgi:hypothetical protein